MAPGWFSDALIGFQSVENIPDRQSDDNVPFRKQDFSFSTVPDFTIQSNKKTSCQLYGNAV